MRDVQSYGATTTNGSSSSLASSKPTEERRRTSNQENEEQDQPEQQALDRYSSNGSFYVLVGQEDANERGYIIGSIILFTYFACQLSQNVLPVATLGMTSSIVLTSGLIGLGDYAPAGTCPAPMHSSHHLSSFKAMTLTSNVNRRLSEHELVNWGIERRAWLLSAGALGALLACYWPLKRPLTMTRGKTRISAALVAILFRAVFLPQVIRSESFSMALLIELVASLLVQSASQPLMCLLSLWFSGGQLTAARETCALVNWLSIPVGALISSQFLTIGFNWSWCIRWPALLALPLLLIILSSDIGECPQDPGSAPPLDWPRSLSRFTSRWNLKLMSFLPTFSTEILHLRAYELSLIAGLQGVSTVAVFMVLVALVPSRPHSMAFLVREVLTALVLVLAHLLLALLDCKPIALTFAASLIPWTANFQTIGEPSPADVLVLPASSYIIARLGETWPGSARVAWRGIWLWGAALRALSCLVVIFTPASRSM